MNAAAARGSSHRKQQVGVCIVAGLFLGDFILCGYLPSQQRLTSLRAAQAQQQQVIQMAQAQSRELPDLKARLKETEEIVARFDSYVPVDNALGTFLQQIAVMMAENELTDQVVLPGKEMGADGLGCIPIHVACKGSLTNLFRFFHSVQTMDRLVRIEKVTLENDAGFTGRLTLQTDAFIYYQLHRPATPGADNAKSPGGASHGT